MSSELSMHKHENGILHVYALFDSRIVRFSLLFFPLIGISLTAFGLLTFLPSLQESVADSLGTTSLGLVVFILMIYFYRAFGQTKLVVIPDGITYSAFGYRMYTPWKNVMGLERFRPYPFTILHARTFPAFQLRQNYRFDLKISEGRQQEVPVLETSWWNPPWSMGHFAKRFPLLEVIVGHNWQERAFGRDVRQYAPWIFHTLS